MVTEESRPLEAADQHRLDAACGWLELGNEREAEAELDSIQEACQFHPEVLQVRWQITARREDWLECLDLAKTLTQLRPNRRFGWIHLAFSLHRLNRTEEAREILLYAIDLFEPSATVAFFLSRYCCRLGNVPEGREWLDKAFELARQPAERRRLKQRALSEPDLAPLQGEIERM